MIEILLLLVLFSCSKAVASNTHHKTCFITFSCGEISSHINSASVHTLVKQYSLTGIDRQKTNVMGISACPSKWSSIIHLRYLEFHWHPHRDFLGAGFIWNSSPATGAIVVLCKFRCCTKWDRCSCRSHPSCTFYGCQLKFAIHEARKRHS